MSEILQNDPQSEVSSLERLRLHLEETGIPKAWLARKFGKQRTFVTNILRGRTKLTPELQAKIEEVLKIKL
jgi:antitoxin component HigA of HigAB toxin-antitoxin module